MSFFFYEFFLIIIIIDIAFILVALSVYILAVVSTLYYCIKIYPY